LVTNNKSMPKIEPIMMLIKTPMFNPLQKIMELAGKGVSGPKATQIPPTSRCPVCGGTGISPSSQDGDWMVDPRKSIDQYRDLYKKEITRLADIEKKMGLGGNHIIDITKNKVETIGLVMNDFGNVRMDSVGKITNDGVYVDNLGAYVHMKESPMFEYVHVDDMPGGSYSLNVANRYNILVGSGGLSMKSYGSVEMSGTITNVGGEQLNLSSEFETNISAGNRLSLEADIVSIKNRQGGQVLIDSNFGVNGNVVIKGGLHVDGELSVNHITAPLEYQVTEPTQVTGQLVGGMPIGTVWVPYKHYVGPLTVFAIPTPMTVNTYSHDHAFANIPLDLKDSNEAVRKEAKANNDPITNPARPIVNTKKSN